MEVIRPRFSISGWLTSIALVIILVFLLQLAIRTLHSGQSSFFRHFYFKHYSWCINLLFVNISHNAL